MQQPDFSTLSRKLLPLRQQLPIQNHWLRQRLDRLMPELLARAELDIWLVIAREYNEDPVLMSLLPQPWMSARRRTILVFCRQPDGSVERLSVSRYPIGDFYTPVWEPEKESQAACLKRILEERQPASIGINLSETFAFGDGLSQQEHQRLADLLGPELMARTRSAEGVAIGWLERRIPEELTVYPDIVALGHSLIREAFSRRVITPGITTTEDVVWWMRQQLEDHNLRPWFQPTIEIQAPGQSFEASNGRSLILPGDLLHCDVGFHYLGLATDQQQHAYVLKPRESAPPEGLQAALRAGNRLQEIHLEEMQIGRTGNQVLDATLARATAEGLTPSVYSHPLGYHGHAAGPTIGLWDMQSGVPGKGDYPLYDMTCYSIELNVKHPVPEWDNQVVRIALEEDAALVDGEMGWLDGRQTTLHLI